MALLELGLVDGMAFSSSSVDAIEAAINTAVHAGDIKATIRTVAPTGWLMMNGQVVVNAQTLYPDLWTVAPAEWKSGTALTLPNMANRVPIGAGATALNAIGGANMVAIEQANLPAVGVTVNPPPTAITGSAVDAVAVSGFSVASTGGYGNRFDPAVLSVEIAQFISGNLGSGTALSLPAPPHLALNFIIAAW